MFLLQSEIEANLYQMKQQLF